MDTRIIPDITDTPAGPAAEQSERSQSAHRPAVRRFVVDPASSPTLLAALAWDATPRQHP